MQMKKKELKELYKFFEDNKENLIVSRDNGKEDSPYNLLWDDYKEAYEELQKISKDEPRLYCYTLIEGEGNGYISGGWHYVNRLGYFISKTKVNLDLVLRYF